MNPALRRPLVALLSVSLVALLGGCDDTAVAQPLSAPSGDTGAAPTEDTMSDTPLADAAVADTATPDAPPADAATPAPELRVATYNASLFRGAAGQLARELEGGADAQARAVAEVLQRVRPDVVLINEFDGDPDRLAPQRFIDAYLAVSQGGAEPIVYPYWYAPASNTGVSSGLDLNRDGQVVTTPGSQAYGNDSWGFGVFPEQYGMVILSRYPIEVDAIRTFQTLRWSAMPDNLLPRDWFGDAIADALRLSSKNHVDVPITIEGRRLHVLASHPTPPSFDGPEDRNGRRNHDEIRFWTDYLSGGDTAAWIVDDAGVAGGFDPEAAFVVLGDLNSDPFDGDSRRDAVIGLLQHPRVSDPAQRSEGGGIAAERDGGVNAMHGGDPRLDTANFSDGRVGNLRVDYALPASTLTIRSSGVFWPGPEDPFAALASASDHHLVWVDVTLDGR